MIEKIDSITSYIKKIAEITSELKKNHKIVVFRGEPDVYPTPGMPGIYRDNHLKKNAYFERNLLGEMKVNNLTKGDTWLEMAVDSQHDGMPSRLLDVSYNSLVALYFAVTPFYKGHRENEYDGEKDGHVLVYAFNDIYCPDRKSDITNFFDDIINRKRILCESYMCQENHKLIDHVKVNQRICVQQGAFILFPGNDFLTVSKSDFRSIVIDRDARAEIRSELSELFGINTAYIYPEPFNYDKELLKKSENVTGNVINFTTEFSRFFKKMAKEIDYYKDKVIELVRWKDEQDIDINSIRNIVEELELSLLRFQAAVNEWKSEGPPKELMGNCLVAGRNINSEKPYDDLKIIYNDIIRDYIAIFAPLVGKYYITLSENELLIDD